MNLRRVPLINLHAAVASHLRNRVNRVHRGSNLFQRIGRAINNIITHIQQLFIIPDIARSLLIYLEHRRTVSIALLCRGDCTVIYHCNANAWEPRFPCTPVSQFTATNFRFFIRPAFLVLANSRYIRHGSLRNISVPR